MMSFMNKSMRKKEGQAGLVILLVVAFALIFYAVTLNLGRISENKVSTEIGANTGAASLASAMASYGHSLLMQQLGGERKKCQSTGFFKALISFIVIVILVVVTYGVGAIGATAAITTVAVAGVGVVLQMSIGSQITSAWNNLEANLLDTVDQFMANAMRGAIQVAANDNKQVPDLYDSDMDGIFGLHPVTSEPLDTMNRYAKYYPLLLDQIAVNYLPAAEQFLVDLQDFIYKIPGPNGDCFGTTCGPASECDLDSATCQPAWALIDPMPGTFVPGLQTSTINYSFSIPLDPSHPCHVDINVPYGNPVTDPFPFSVPSECNLCCLPDTVPDPRGPSFGQIQVRPGCCDCRGKPPTIQIPDPTNPSGPLITVPNPDYCDPTLFPPNLECGTASTCQLLSPYGAVEPSLGTFYQWVFDENFENSENTFFSFRELLGKDDENQRYFKDSSNPNWAQQFAPPWQGIRYYVDDTTGFYSGYTAPPPSTPENRIGVFPFLWKIHDWGTDLDSLDTVGTLVIGNPVYNPFDQRCKWCDSRAATLCSPNLPYEMNQLVLRNDPSTMTYDTSYCVETYVDDVTLALTGSFEIPVDTCAPDPYAGGAFWKRGSDQFCSNGDIDGPSAWPYSGQCAKFLNGNCTTNVSGTPEPSICECEDPTSTSPADTAAANFPEDILDEMIYNTHTFTREADSLLQYSRGQLASQFETWFENWQRWIDPGQGLANAASPGGTGNFGNCYPYDWDNDPGTPDECQPFAGQLYLWLQALVDIRDELSALAVQSFQGSACATGPWCVPPRGCPDVSAYEELTFDFNGDGTDGQIEDVVACLNYAIHGYDYTCNGGVPDVACLNASSIFDGNDAQYNDCKLTCSLAECTNLPRTLVTNPPYDRNAYVQADPLDEPDMAAMLQCVHACSDLTCRGMAAGLPWNPVLSAMPLTQSSSGAAYAYSGTISNFNAIFDCNGNDLNDARGMRTLVRDSLVQANPICDINPGGWLASTGTAAIEAENQIDKFIMRRDYLDSRMTELNYFRNILTTAIVEFEDFLTNAVPPLIDERIAYDAAPPDDWPNQIVYGWQEDNSPENRPAAPGEAYWHIVKVEGRIPKRCNNACGVGGGPDPKWPKVETYTRKGGLKRCYELFNTDGIVKFRVTRYDESPTPAGGGLRFPNGQPIWKFRFFHPHPTRASVSAATLGSTCDSIMIVDPQIQYPTVPASTFKGAFIMNRRRGTSPADPILGNNYNCWNRSHFILANSGIMSETCARYYYKDGIRKGLTFSFIDCPGGF